MGKLRILLADDHVIVREGLKRIINGADDLEVAAEAGDGNSVLAAIRNAEFDVVLLDMSMPGPSGVDLVRRIKAERPSLPILVLSMHAEENFAVRTIRAGASGYLSKESASGELVSALRKVGSRGTYVSEAIAQHLVMSLSMREHTELPHNLLSDRELEVFLALVNGEQVTSIAARLFLSVKTVSTHKARVMEKMGLASVADLVRYAIDHKLTGRP